MNISTLYAALVAASVFSAVSAQANVPPPKLRPSAAPAPRKAEAFPANATVLEFPRTIYRGQLVISDGGEQFEKSKLIKVTGFKALVSNMSAPDAEPVERRIDANDGSARIICESLGFKPHPTDPYRHDLIGRDEQSVAISREEATNDILFNFSGGPGVVLRQVHCIEK